MGMSLRQHHLRITRRQVWTAWNRRFIAQIVQRGCTSNNTSPPTTHRHDNPNTGATGTCDMCPHPTHIPYVVKVVPPGVVQYGGLAQRLIRTAHVLQQRHAGALDHAAGQQACKTLQQQVLYIGNKGGQRDGVENKGLQVDSSGEVVAGLSGAAAEDCVHASEVEEVGRGKGEREEMCLACRREMGKVPGE